MTTTVSLFAARVKRLGSVCAGVVVALETRETMGLIRVNRVCSGCSGPACWTTGVTLAESRLKSAASRALKEIRKTEANEIDLQFTFVVFVRTEFWSSRDCLGSFAFFPGRRNSNASNLECLDRLQERSFLGVDEQSQTLKEAQ